MSILRSLAGVFGGLVFVTALAFVIVSMAMANFTDYSNLREPVTEMIVSTMPVLEPNQTQNMLNDLQDRCANVSTITQSLGELNVTLNCTDVSAATTANIYSVVAGSVVDYFHYKDYGCSYIECMRSDRQFDEKAMMAVLSVQAHEFYSSVVIYLIIIAAIGGALMAWSTGSVQAAMRSFGWSFVAIGTGYFFMGMTKMLIPTQVASQTNIASMMNPLFSTLGQYFLYSLVVGIVLLVAGYGLPFIGREKKNK